MPDEVVLWCGKPVKSMDREELLQAFQQLARMHKRQTDEHLRQLSHLGEFSRAALSEETQ